MRLNIVPSTILVACLLGTAASQSDNKKTCRSSGPHRQMRRDVAPVKLPKTCDDCQIMMETLKRLIKHDDSVLMEAAKRFCLADGKYDQEFCDGAMEREVPIMASVLRTVETGSPSSKHLCASIFGICDLPPIDEWALYLPPMEKCSGENKPVSGKKPLQIIHYSDVHVDPLYKAGASTRCKKSICCRSSETDSLGNNSHPASPFGEHECDTPMTLEKSMYEYIKKKFPHAAFALFTGDIVDHGIHNTSKKYNKDIIEHAYSTMHDYIDIVYGTAGNHEAHPINNFVPGLISNKTQWLYDSLSEQWSHEVNNTSSTKTRAMGAYSTKYPKGNLRIISLNTNMYYRFNFILYQKTMQRDPDGQLAWLAKELHAAEEAAENVYIIGHMPLGSSDALPNGSNYFSQIVKRYSKTIKAMFFGHTHADHFQISYTNYVNRFSSTAFAMSYICPSLTPTAGHPAFRVYDVDPETFAVLDATTYIADMSSPDFHISGPRWKKYYSAKEAYGYAVTPQVTDPAAELSPSFWHNVTEVFEVNDALFDEYMARKSRGWKAESKCRDACKKNEICALRAGRAENNCWKPGMRNGVAGLGKREEVDDHHHGHHDACGEPVSVELLRGLTERQSTVEAMCQICHASTLPSTRLWTFQGPARPSLPTARLSRRPAAAVLA
ncbi:hypothetical protein E4U42_000264 [Claviceps africana]|uniref:Sphingomyelin phosphodiesterase n=1 Tax=Claviceps africana TaxID=83212 RepID=A0A8K0NFP6_9HYPO|nr:hypothetical protein E4U42_000264 [Claviceps africana]